MRSVSVCVVCMCIMCLCVYGVGVLCVCLKEIGNLVFYAQSTSLVISG